MPRPLVPHKSGVHRAACFGLFRALLRPRKRILDKSRRPDEYSTRIRAIFERNRGLLGHTKVTEALQLGYVALTALHDHNKRKFALDRLFDFQLPSPSAIRKPVVIPAKPKKTPDRPATSILERPFLNISGRRHVPRLVSANKFPYLRIKKPQPAKLSRMIRQSAERREARLTRIERYQGMMDIGREEDQWDSLIAQDLGLEAENTSISWSEAPADALQEVKRARAREIEKRMVMAKKMTQIIEAEEALVAEDQRQRKDMLHKKRKERRLLRQGRDPSEVLFEFENAEEAEISFPLLPPPVDVDVPARFEQLKSRDRTVDEDAVTSTPAKDLHPAQRESTESLFRDSSDDRRDRQFLHFAAQINEFKETALPYLTHEGSMGPEAFIPNEAHVARKLIRKASYTPRIPRIQTESSEEEAFRASGSPHLTQWRRISLNLPRHNNKSAKRRLRRHRNAKIWAARWANYADRFKNTQLIEHRPMDFIVALAEATLTPALSKRKMQERLWNLGAETRKFKEEAELARSEREAIDKAHEEGVSTVRRLIGGAKGSSSK